MITLLNLRKSIFESMNICLALANGITLLKVSSSDLEAMLQEN